MILSIFSYAYLSSVYLLFFFLINLFIFGCVGSSFLCEGFLQLRWAGATLHRGGHSSSRRPLFIAARGPLTIAASLVAEHRLQTRRLSNCGSRAQLLRSMWDLPRPGLEPMSPALAGGFSTTAPPGKPCISSLVRYLDILPFYFFLFFNFKNIYLFI